MWTLSEVSTIVRNVTYKEWCIDVKADKGGRMYLQCSFMAPDVQTGETDTQKSRKWWLSSHMTETELVATAFKAVLGAEEHEVRENFKYNGIAVFHPHINVRDLMHVVKECKPDKRS